MNRPNYIRRFNDMKVEIMDCQDVVACNAFSEVTSAKIYDYMVEKAREPLRELLRVLILEEEARMDMRGGQERACCAKRSGKASQRLSSAARF
ncbi:hypothetical protein FNV43_RR06328 [Rhamnella rubrinervis]|uniref:Uncharacterized protein n=1 Tax=Rhamnella rubrinervis TaxID=2594499 RepID=A0A8K0MLN9_9ROSA|nr:hypothetical protein FNV43_RR06328 [Rhamnella rubrinervis]